MRCDEFVREWQLAEACGEVYLSAAAAAHLAACSLCQAVALVEPSLDAAVREALAARAIAATPRPTAVAAARDAAVAALPSRGRAVRRPEPLRFVALPPTMAGWAVAAALLIAVGLLGRAPFGGDEVVRVAQTATVVAALPSATPSPTVSRDAPPTAVSLARPAVTPLPQP